MRLNLVCNLKLIGLVCSARMGFWIRISWFLAFAQLYLSDAVTNTTLEDVEDELVLAQVIYRHGNRTIFRTYDNDPYKSEHYWPEGFSQLTNVGMQTQYELGLYLRRRYDKLIGTGYSADKIYIRSSDTDRTILSALCNAAGLFPPSAEEVWDESINWQPIPIHTIPLDEDYLVYQSIPCDRIDKLLSEYLESPEIKMLLERFREFRAFLEKHSGIQFESLTDFVTLNEVLTIENLRGLPLSNWAELALKSTDNTLDYMAGRFFYGYSHTKEMKKAKTGFLIKEIFERFKNKTMNLLNPDRSLWIYSAHDNTIINVLNALNVYKHHIPPFAASVHLELFKNGHEYYVQLFYRTDNSEIIPPINIPNCGIKCSLNKLYELFGDILPTDEETYESLCHLDIPPDVEFHNQELGHQ